MKPAIATMLHLEGVLLRWMWNIACAAILYFAASATFYEGSWTNAGMAVVIAAVLYGVSASFDLVCGKLFAPKESSNPEAVRKQDAFLTATCP